MNVLIIEDHPITTLGLVQILEKNFDGIKIQTAGDGVEAIEKLKGDSFEVIITDIVLPNTDSNALLMQIKNIQPQSRVLVYSNNPDEVYAMHFINMGASGYINKSQSMDNFVMGIKMILAGQLFMSEKVIKKHKNEKSNFTRSTSPFTNLTKRELEVFNHLIKGERLKDICHIMKLKQSTISTLKTRIMTKLGVDNLVDLTSLAYEYGLK